MSTRWLIDKSAYARLHLAPDADEWFERVNRGLVSIATVTLLEIGYSSKSKASWHREVRQIPIALMPVQHLTPRMEMRAVDVQGQLAERGHHRAAKIPDLLIAAAAELTNLTVLHVDKDFELIAEVTGQVVERLDGDF